MLKKNVAGLEKMAADYLQYRYGIYLHAEGYSDINNYSHTVWFPDDKKCEKLNFNAWKE